MEANGFKLFGLWGALGRRLVYYIYYYLKEMIIMSSCIENFSLEAPHYLNLGWGGREV